MFSSFVKVKSKCENCDFEYIRIDDHIQNEKMSHKDFEDFYDNIYDGVSDDDMDVCPDCNSFVFPEEIINIKEHKIKCPWFKSVSSDFREKKKFW